MAKEPKCLVKPESKWYRPGSGFTCRQIMMPLLLAAILCLVQIIVSVFYIAPSADGLLKYGTLTISALVLFLVVRSVIKMRQMLLAPLTQIRFWVSKMRGGDLTARMPSLIEGEFDELSKDINDLASLIESLNMDLEAEVATKTEKLANKTQSLELLYEIVTLINNDQESETVLVQIMDMLADVYQADGAVLRLKDEGSLNLIKTLGTVDSEYIEESIAISSLFPRSSLRRSGLVSEVNARLSMQGGRVIILPFEYNETVMGAFQFFVSKSHRLENEDILLLTRVGQNLGVLLEKSRLDNESTKLLMVEEKARLSGELHDSLAQTLASLRFQVRILDHTLHQQEEKQAWQELEKLEDQVEQANLELRSLIEQFRAPLQSINVVSAVQKLIDKFQRETNVRVFFQNEWEHDNLSLQQRTDVIRIIQEALNNIKKHADATSVRVLLRNSQDDFRVIVEDDGVGYDEHTIHSSEAGHHIGREIMQERAHSLNAELRMESEPGEGVLISLTSKPEQVEEMESMVVEPMRMVN